MTRANWARTLARLQRYAEVLRAYDCEVIMPPNMETPPRLRSGKPPERQL